MNENKTNKAMYETQPAVSELNKVPGFNPLNFMRKTVLKDTRQEILYLDLKYKKLWFRLAYPKGYIKKNVLKITEQIAIIEAKLYLDNNDKEPVSSFTVQRNADGRTGPLYIQDAQSAAENQVLIDAGFGIQFCDISQGSDFEIFDRGTAVNTASTDANEKQQQANEVPIKKAVEEQQAAQEKEETSVTQPENPVIAKSENKTTAQQNEISGQPETITEQKTAETVSQTVNPDIMDSTETATVQQNEIVNQPVDSNKQEIVQTDSPENVGQNDMKEIETEQPQDDITQNSSYTADMPVEEILKIMTLEEAGVVIVDTGVCKGLMMADVMEKRQGSLRWYINGYTGENNIMRAAAKMMLDYYNEKNKAG